MFGEYEMRLLRSGYALPFERRDPLATIRHGVTRELERLPGSELHGELDIVVRERREDRCDVGERIDTDRWRGTGGEGGEGIRRRRIVRCDVGMVVMFSTLVVRIPVRQRQSGEHEESFRPESMIRRHRARALA